MRVGDGGYSMSDGGNYKRERLGMVGLKMDSVGNSRRPYMMLNMDI